MTGNLAASYNQLQRGRPAREAGGAGKNKVNQTSSRRSGPDDELFRLAAAGAFAPAVAHTLNNLLNIVSLRVDSIELGAPDAAALAEDVRVMRRNLERSAQLLAVWSELSRFENSALDADLRRECEAALAFAGLVYGKKFSAALVDAGAATIVVPAGRTRRAVLAAIVWLREASEGDLEARIRIAGGAEGAWSVELETSATAPENSAQEESAGRAALAATIQGLAEACGAQATLDAAGRRCRLTAPPS